MGLFDDIFGGGSAPKSPKVKKQVHQADQSAVFSYDKAQDMFKWAMDQFTKNSAVSDEAIDNALGWMDRMSDWATSDRQRYEEVFKPLEDSLVKEATSYASPERLALESGKAQEDIAAQFDAARQSAQDRLESYGVDPSQTRQGALDLGTRVAEGAARASAGNQARWHAEEVGRELRDKAIALGAKLPGQALSEAQASGNFGTSAVNTGLATTASGAQTMGTPMQWEQIGQQGTGLAANIKNQKFQNDMAKWQADQQSGSGFGEIAGTITGYLPYMAMAAEGGVIPDEMSPSGGEVTDDVPAQINGGPPARLNAGEFVMPKDIVSWLGEKGMQAIVMKARKEMTNGNGERPAQPTMAPAAYDSVGAIPEG